MNIYAAIGLIKDYDIYVGTKKIIDQYYDILTEAPASVSGKYHSNETMEDHLVRTAYFVEQFIKEFDIRETADILRSAALLHDIGNCELVYKGNYVDDWDSSLIKPGDSWKYYGATGWSRNNSMTSVHPILSAKIIGLYPFKKSNIIQALVITHMSHWSSKECLSPDVYNIELKRLAEIICMSDYLAARKEIKIDAIE